MPLRHPGPAKSTKKPLGLSSKTDYVTSRNRPELHGRAALDGPELICPKQSSVWQAASETSTASQIAEVPDHTKVLEHKVTVS